MRNKKTIKIRFLRISRPRDQARILFAIGFSFKIDFFPKPANKIESGAKINDSESIFRKNPQKLIENIFLVFFSKFFFSGKLVVPIESTDDEFEESAVASASKKSSKQRQRERESEAKGGLILRGESSQITAKVIVGIFCSFFYGRNHEAKTVGIFGKIENEVNLYEKRGKEQQGRKKVEEHPLILQNLFLLFNFLIATERIFTSQEFAAFPVQRDEFLVRNIVEKHEPHSLDRRINERQIVATKKQWRSNRNRRTYYINALIA